MTTENPTTEERCVAAAFHAAIRAACSGAEVAEIDRRNRERNDGSCATHDFLDPNTVMAEAFETATGRDSFNGDGRIGEQVLTVLNAAWDIAMAHGFARSWIEEPHPSTPLSERWDRESFRAYWREDDNELLAALEGLVAACTIPDEDEPETMTQARAAIAKAGGAA